MNNKYYQTRYKYSQNRKVVWRAICEHLQRYIGKNMTIVDLGCGYCDFINNIQGKKKIAVDLNPDSRKFCETGIRFIHSKSNDLKKISDNSIDAVFASNLLEHLTDEEINQTLAEVKRVLKENKILILMQPNYKYCSKEYFDDYTHKKIFSHLSLKDMVEACGLTNELMIPKFLPFSFKSRLPSSYLLTKLYLNSPIKPYAKQMLLIFRANHVE